jgi:hypothetical protein
MGCNGVGWIARVCRTPKYIRPESFPIFHARNSRKHSPDTPKGTGPDAISRYPHRVICSCPSSLLINVREAVRRADIDRDRQRLLNISITHHMPSVPTEKHSAPSSPYQLVHFTPGPTARSIAARLCSLMAGHGTRESAQHGRTTGVSG